MPFVEILSQPIWLCIVITQYTLLLACKPTCYVEISFARVGQPNPIFGSMIKNLSHHPLQVLTFSDFNLHSFFITIWFTTVN